MKIILATYGYPPHYWGGSESYVHWLAQFLQSQGHEPVVIAGVTDGHLKGAELFFEDEYLKAGRYEYEGIPVIACANQVTTREIYSKYNPAWKASWTGLLSKYWKGQAPVPLLHLHALSSLVNTSLVEAAKAVFPKIKTLYSYHIPESCPKGTLLFFKKNMCQVRPEPSICTACMLSDRLGVSPGLAKAAAALLPGLPWPDGVPSLLRTKELAALHIRSYRRFVEQVDRWLAFSHQIEAVLLRLGVGKEKISVIRHGIASDFFEKTKVQHRADLPTTFVFVGRFKMVKGLHTLLRAWLDMAPSPSRRLWLIGGDQDLHPRIAELLEKTKNRSDIEHLGTLPAEEVRARLETAHCIVIPSEWVEIGPLTLHEAIACGANVIASDIGGCAELSGFYGDVCQTFRMAEVADLQAKIKDFRYRPVQREVRGQEEHNELILKEYDRVLAATDEALAGSFRRP